MKKILNFFNKFNSPKAKMYAIVGVCFVTIVLVFVIIASVIPDSSRVIYEQNFDGTYKVVDVKSLYRGGIFARESLEISSEYKGEKVTSIKRIDSTVYKEIILPDTIKTIENSAFNGSESLEKINLPNGLKKIGNNTFANCVNLKEITIPSTVTEIGDKAFSNTALKEITLPSGLVKLGANAFSGSKYLETINFDISKLENIGGGAFSGTKYAADKYVKVGNFNYLIIEKVLYNIEPLNNGTEKDVEIVLPEGIEIINNGVIHEELNITKVTLPKSLVEIRTGAFCRNDPFQINKLKVVLLQSNVKVYEKSFDYCNRLKTKVYLFDESEIDETNVDEKSTLAKALLVYTKDNQYYTNIEVDGEKVTCLFDIDELKPYTLFDGQKEYIE